MPSLKEYEHQGNEEFDEDDKEAVSSNRKKVAKEKAKDIIKDLSSKEINAAKAQEDWMSPENPYLWEPVYQD